VRPLLAESNLRNRAKMAYREYRAIMILANWLVGEDRLRVDKSLEVLPTLPRQKLQEKYSKIRRELTELKLTLGAKAKLSEYEKLLSGIPGHTPEKGLLFMPKHLIQQYYFDHYERVFPLFASLPPHARIGINIFDISGTAKGKVEFSLLEATLFEDMAFLWNATMDAIAEVNAPQEAPLIKRRIALMRATARAIFYLLEGYINGMAVDILVTTKPNVLTRNEKSKLEEWDDDKKQPRLLRLRDKLLQYPKIALRAEHPPLQESNCPEIALLLEKEETVRHPLVHPTPKIEEWRDASLRESAFFNLTVDQVGEMVDAVIRLIGKFNEAVGEQFGGVNEWLHSRGADGRFSEAAFG